MAVLKYKDPITGDWIELSNAVGDTLPIGAIVEYDGTTVPTNWEKVGESGGGTKDGNEVEVADTEPTDATVDLWVDTSEEGEFFQVVDDLTSDSSTNALSAKQGKVLYDTINSNILNGTLLWHGEIGEPNATATLTDSANNYQYILVRGVWNNGNYATRCGILYPEYQTTSEILINWSNSSYSYHYRLLF